MTEYAEIIPENHSEKAKYMELHNEKQLVQESTKSFEPEGFADDDYEDVEDDLNEYKSASENGVGSKQDGPSDAELLARFEQVEAASIDAPDVKTREHGNYGPSMY